MSSLGGRGRERGESWDVGLWAEVVRVRVFGAVLECLCGLTLCGEGGLSDKRENFSMHASRSLSDTALGSYLEFLCNKGICVANEIGGGRTGGG